MQVTFIFSHSQRDYLCRIVKFVDYKAVDSRVQT